MYFVHCFRLFFLTATVCWAVPHSGSYPDGIGASDSARHISDLLSRRQRGIFLLARYAGSGRFAHRSQRGGAYVAAMGEQ